jgi:hypothetical protein
MLMPVFFSLLGDDTLLVFCLLDENVVDFVAKELQH